MSDKKSPLFPTRYVPTEEANPPYTAKPKAFIEWQGEPLTVFLQDAEELARCFPTHDIVLSVDEKDERDFFEAVCAVHPGLQGKVPPPCFKLELDGANIGGFTVKMKKNEGIEKNA